MPTLASTLRDPSPAVSGGERGTLADQDRPQNANDGKYKV